MSMHAYLHLLIIMQIHCPNLCKAEYIHRQPSCLGIVCLFGFNVAIKHLRSYRDSACS